jgi:hypothetical protein
MKKIFYPVVTVVIILFTTGGIPKYINESEPVLTGAWQNESDKGEALLAMDNYLVFTKFNVGSKIFYHTWGGPYTLSSGKLKVQIEFDSGDKDRVGKSLELEASGLSDLILIKGMDATDRTMKRTDDGKAPLAGNWRISGRKQGETMNEIPLRARRTLKMLTGTRFQWMAINIETGEFSGTGGGAYTFRDGKYTENIEFFSRDSSRVGASLTFDGKIEKGEWHHSGLSSRGDPIYEIWTRHK